MTGASRPDEVRIIKPGFDGGVTDSQKLFVVSFDMGGTSGWMACRVQLDALLNGGLRSVSVRSPDPDVFAWTSGRFTGPEPWQAELCMALVRGTWMHGEGVFDQGPESDLFVVVLERFQQRMIAGDDLLSPVRLNAAFVQLAWRAPFPIIMSGTSDAMRVFTDERLRNHNLWSGPPGPNGEHQRDATRHAALLLRKASSETGYLERLEMKMPWMA